MKLSKIWIPTVVVASLLLLLINFIHEKRTSIEDPLTDPHLIIQELASIECNDRVWCEIPMPKISYFRLDPPTDNIKWKKAQKAAASGEYILLNRIKQYFPNFLDFLDGDVRFRDYQEMADYYIDRNTDLSFLVKNGTKSKKIRNFEPYGFHKRGYKVLPAPYSNSKSKRALIIKLGYFGFSQHANTPAFGGYEVGKALVGLDVLLDFWDEVKDHIEIPFIAMDLHDENWGILSTYFPNRTKDWGFCCPEPQKKRLLEFLDHNKTLMFLINQHSNISHPKLLSLPRGMPVWDSHNHKFIWDVMHLFTRDEYKGNRDLPHKLVFTAGSSWRHRPIILDCLRKRFDPDDFETLLFTKKNEKDPKSGLTRTHPADYYKKLGSAKFSIALSGIGYDTFRLWESLTLGTIPVLEKGVGLDKTLWKLPAILLEDLSQVTPNLLRTAYVESIYQIENFELERLTQSFWFSFISQVSAEASLAPLLEKFPLSSYDPDFVRPLERFSCHETKSCGRGTKRIPPVSSCLV